MNVFLTGKIQVGKSTAIRKYLAARPGLRVGGFRTVWDRRFQKVNRIFIVPAAEDVPLTEANCIGIRSFELGHSNFPKVFDTEGSRLLRDSLDCDVILMDEVGIAENESPAFQKAVLDCLDSDVPVLGVVQAKSGVLPDLIRSRPDVRVIEVTEENRDDLVIEL